MTPPGDGGALADAIHALLVNEPLRRAMGGNARRRAEQRFSRVSQIDRLLGVWSSVLH